MRDAQIGGNPTPLTNRVDDAINNLARLTPVGKVGLDRKPLHGVERGVGPVAEECCRVLAVGIRAECHVVERCWLPVSVVVLQERPVAGVVVLVRGEQVENGAGELGLADGCARAECAWLALMRSS